VSGSPLSLAFLCPRYARSGMAGGAETLLRDLARRAVKAGHRVTFLTTCATDHFSWKNEHPPGIQKDEGVEVRFFPVDEGRDVAAFLAAQDLICQGRPVPAEVETRWLRQGVNSSALLAHLREEGSRYDRILAGPYLFALVIAAARACPDRTLLLACLHDEPFARLAAVRDLMASVRGCLFNSEPERDLAERLCGFARERGRVVGMGLEPFESDPEAFARKRSLRAPYVLYAGRREPAKGTPLLVDYLDAFRKRTGRDIRLASCGSGSFEPRDFTIDLGYLSEAEKHEAMAGALAFVHPSRFESLGIVLLESFLAGTPGLVSAYSEVLRWQCERSGAGLWWRVYPEFEECLLRWSDDRALRDGMGRQGRAFVRAEYDWTAVDRRFAEALDRL
jgi:glycosyltransferase involved in cell wall biosynthesis